MSPEGLPSMDVHNVGIPLEIQKAACDPNNMDAAIRNAGREHHGSIEVPTSHAMKRREALASHARARPELGLAK